MSTNCRFERLPESDKLPKEMHPDTNTTTHATGERVSDSLPHRETARGKLSLAAWALLAIGSASCSSELGPKAPDGDASYSFFAAGHSYGDPHTKVRDGLYPPFRVGLSRLLAERSVDFGVLLGDVVFRPSQESWDLVDEQLNELPFPVHLVAGNHDLVPPDWPEELPGYLMRSDWEARYGRTYRSFRRGSDHFVILDPNIDGWRILGDQLAFLDKELEEARGARNLFILMHQVLWFKMSVLPKRVSVNSGFGFQEGQDFEEEILPRLTALNTPVYVFSGDVGAAPKGDTYRVETVENVTFIATGMGAGVADNYTLVEVSTEGEVKLTSIPLGD